MRRRDFLVVLAGAAAWPARALAQPYPNRVIKIVVPFVAGGPVDAAARVLVHHLQMRLNQSVIIENRPGGGTTIGIKTAAAAPPDGYTLLFNGASTIFAPLLYSNFDAEITKNLVPIAPMITWSHVMVVAPSLPVTNLKELAAYAKANPGAVVFGFGQGTAPQILGTSFRNAAGVDFTMLSYRGGDQARADLLGGRVHMNIAPTASLLPLINDGKARPLAYTGVKRSPDLPNVPTTAESGFPSVGYNPDVWFGLFGPAGTPAAVVEKINAAVNESLRSAEMQASLGKLAYEPFQATPQEFAKFIVAESSKWPPLLAAAGIKGE
jgi:tripartite-type tricarboxylate transporter receptor subunit TctC